MNIWRQLRAILLLPGIIAVVILSGTGTITVGKEIHPLRPGSVTVIPAGLPHSLEASAGKELDFVIFGVPPMAMDDERARPRME